MTGPIVPAARGVGGAAARWIENVLARSPFAVSLGVELVSAEPERVVFRLPFRQSSTTVGTIVHGGAIATLIDITGAAASASAIDGDDAFGGATANLTVAFLAPSDGVDILAEGVVVQRGRTQTVTDVAVRDSAGALVAKGLVTSRIFRAK